MKVLVCGDRNWGDAEKVRDRLSDFPQGTVFIAGVCRGADRVTEVTVLEKNPDVIRLVSPYVTHPKIKIVQADVWTWEPPKGALYDTCWFDIWHERSTDNLDEMTKLHRRYRKHLAPGGWMDSWYRDELRRRRRQEQRESSYF